MSHVMNLYLLKQRINSFEKKLILQFFEQASPKLTLDLLMQTHKRAISPSEPAVDCAICQDSISPDSIAVCFPGCRHPFHPECLAPHVEHNSTCPNCRGDLVSSFMQEIISWQPAEAQSSLGHERIDTVPDRPARLLRNRANIRRMPLVELMTQQVIPVQDPGSPRL